MEAPMFLSGDPMRVFLRVKVATVDFWRAPNSFTTKLLRSEQTKRNLTTTPAVILRFCDYHGISHEKHGVYRSIKKWQKAGEHYVPGFITPLIVTSGCPVGFTGKMAKLIKSLKIQPFYKRLVWMVELLGIL